MKYTHVPGWNALKKAKRLARLRAVERGLKAGLNPNTADAAAGRAMEIWHPEFTDQEWMAFVDQEIERHAHP